MLLPTVFDHLLASLICLVLPAVGAMQQRGSTTQAEPAEFEPWEKIATYWSNSAVLALLAALGLLTWWAAGRTWHDLGLTAPPARLGWGLLLALLFLLVYALDTWRQLIPERLPATRARWRRDTPFMPQTALEVRYSLVLVSTAAVAEEILYRGFLIAYAAHFTGPSALGLAAAVALPAAVFGFSHFYQGWRAVFKILLLATVFGAIFLVTHSLWIPILLHFLVDLIGMLLGPKLLGPGKGGAAST